MSDKPKNSQPSTESSSLTLESLQALEKEIRPPAKTMSTSLSVPTESPGKVRREPRSALFQKKTTKGALANFEDAVGGRDVLIETLQLSTLDKKQEHFLRILSDPARQNDTLSIIARDSDILPSQVIELFRHASFAKAHAIAQAQLSEAIPSIMRDITDKSVDADIDCPTCMGVPPLEGQCLSCNGRGWILRPSDLDRQKIALEVGGLLKKGGGVNVQVNQQVGMISPNSFFSKYVKTSDEAAYNVGAIEGEVVKKESDGS